MARRYDQYTSVAPSSMFPAGRVVTLGGDGYIADRKHSEEDGGSENNWEWVSGPVRS